MLGTLAAPSLLGSCTGSESDKAAGISFAMNYFKVSEGDLRKVLAAALEKGGDYADLFFEHSYRNNVGLQDAPVDERIVVSEIGEQWSPKTEPARVAASEIIVR